MSVQKYKDPSLVPLVIIISASILFQIFLLLVIDVTDLWHIAVYPAFIIFEMSWIVLMGFMFRSLYKKVIEIHTEKNFENESLDIYIRKCPDCKSNLDDKNFESKKGKQWKVKYCPQCQKAVHRRLVTELPAS